MDNNDNFKEDMMFKNEENTENTENTEQPKEEENVDNLITKGSLDTDLDTAVDYNEYSKDVEKEEKKKKTNLYLVIGSVLLAISIICFVIYFFL